MQFRAMVTNGGPHPAEKWAVVTGEQIFPISDTVDGDRLILAKKTQLAVIEALTDHHAGVQTSEKGHLSARGADRLREEPAHHSDADAALDAVIAALAGTPWEEKTKDTEWQSFVHGIIAQHFATSIDIERQWHCRRNPSPDANAFLAAKNGA